MMLEACEAAEFMRIRRRTRGLVSAAARGYSRSENAFAYSGGATRPRVSRVSPGATPVYQPE
jgi:hypothetical protein